MTRFHQGSPHFEPVWIDQTPGARSDQLPGPWPVENYNAPDETEPTPDPDPTPPAETFPVFDEDSIVNDPALRDELRAPMRAAVRRWNALIGYSRDQRNALRASWTGGGPVWNGATWWPQEINVRLNDGSIVSFEKIRYFNGGTPSPGVLVPIAACGRALPEQFQNENQLCQGFFMSINEDLIGFEGQTDEDWQRTFEHELVHGLGFQRTCWDDFVDTTAGTLSGGDFPTALTAYRTATGRTVSNMLLHPTVPGTNPPAVDLSHWEDQERDGVPGFTNELMCPVDDDDAVITALTLGVLNDQGYQIIGEPEGTPNITRRLVSPAHEHGHMHYEETIIYDNYFEKNL